MVTILEYVLLGLLLYILVIPVLEELATLICQGLENIKGLLIYKQTILQQQIDNIKEEYSSSKTSTTAIGFSIPTIDEEEEEEV